MDIPCQVAKNHLSDQLVEGMFLCVLPDNLLQIKQELQEHGETSLMECGPHIEEFETMIKSHFKDGWTFVGSITPSKSTGGGSIGSTVEGEIFVILQRNNL